MFPFKKGYDSSSRVICQKYLRPIVLILSIDRKNISTRCFCLHSTNHQISPLPCYCLCKSPLEYLPGSTTSNLVQGKNRKMIIMGETTWYFLDSWKIKTKVFLLFPPFALLSSSPPRRRCRASFGSSFYCCCLLHQGCSNSCNSPLTSLSSVPPKFWAHTRSLAALVSVESSTIFYKDNSSS